MDNWQQAIIPVVAIAAWASIMLYRMHVAGRMREQAHKERMAMIERGLVPPADGDPAQYERIMDPRGVAGSAARHQRTGITLMGVGAGLMVMMYLTGGGRAMGAGAFLIVLGAAFLVNAMLAGRSQEK